MKHLPERAETRAGVGASLDTGRDDRQRRSVGFRPQMKQRSCRTEVVSWRRPSVGIVIRPRGGPPQRHPLAWDEVEGADGMLVARLRGGTRIAIRSGTKEGRMARKKKGQVKNRKQYRALKRKGMSKERAARIANAPGATKRGGKKSRSRKKRSSTTQGGTSAQKKAAAR